MLITMEPHRRFQKLRQLFDVEVETVRVLAEKQYGVIMSVETIRRWEQGHEIGSRKYQALLNILETWERQVSESFGTDND